MPTRSALASLLSGTETSYRGDADTVVTGIAYDSRKVEPGDVFVAVPGFVHDGLRFVAEAVAAGAVAVVAEADLSDVDLPTAPNVWAHVPDARAVLAPMSAVFYGNPSHDLTVVGVTGTNGKTTVTALIEAILAARGPVGRWSTTTVRVAGVPYPAHRTTPEGPDLQKVLRRMVDADCWAAAIEVSSHALTLRRVDGTRFAAAVFTNLSNDHLDFHTDMGEYLEAKAMLFERLEADAVAVLNVDDPASATLAERTKARVVGYGWAPPPVIDVPTYRIARWEYLGSGSRLRLETPQGELEFESPLFGPANGENLAAAIALAFELGVSADEIAAPLAAFEGARGRFQRLLWGQPFTVLVDFAHTPAALQSALAASRDLAAAHRVIVVFGCGGDRDRGKRPVMGKIAADAADQVIITSDNPRSEDPDAILEEVEAGVPEGTRAQVEREVDRLAAIVRALERARPGDCVLIAGKGHETEQEFADHKIEFDDAAVAGEWLEARFGRTAAAEAEAAP
ncbi:MAG: UDP-N-acetylmuramoyl-L-alanyl-D-glutamate--2,6-diaminopimelate ligase [Acidobacteria bacterium]|nr:UDP-N-acetylmuramoyl-L-alanyl-D-glutamate--2,6-diaminopimelate ligase [Acidobacteriota bacterium]